MHDIFTRAKEDKHIIEAYDYVWLLFFGSISYR